MKFQVSYFTKARRCALQGRNYKEMRESIIQILGHFRPIWNTRAISNKEKSAPHLSHPIPLLPTALETPQRRFLPSSVLWLWLCFLSIFLFFLSLLVIATIQVNTQGTPDYSRVNPALSWEHKPPKVQGKPVISTLARAEWSMDERCGCLLYKSYQSKGLFLSFLLGFGWTVHLAKCWALTLTAGQEGVTRRGSSSHQQWKSRYQYKVWEKYLLEVQL